MMSVMLDPTSAALRGETRNPQEEPTPPAEVFFVLFFVLFCFVLFCFVLFLFLVTLLAEGSTYKKKQGFYSPQLRMGISTRPPARLIGPIARCGADNTRQAKSPTRRLLRKSAPGLTRSCDPESTSICGDVGEVDPQSRSVAATREWPAAAGQAARLIGVDLRLTQRGRPRVEFDRSRPAAESARGRPRVDVGRSRPAHCTQKRFRRHVGVRSVRPRTSRGLLVCPARP